MKTYEDKSIAISYDCVVFGDNLSSKEAKWVRILDLAGTRPTKAYCIMYGKHGRGLPPRLGFDRCNSGVPGDLSIPALIQLAVAFITAFKLWTCYKP